MSTPKATRQGRPTRRRMTLAERQAWVTRHRPHATTTEDIAWHINDIDHIKPLYQVDDIVQMGKGDTKWRVDYVHPRKDGRIGHDLLLRSTSKRETVRFVPEHEQGNLRLISTAGLYGSPSDRLFAKVHRDEQRIADYPAKKARLANAHR